MGGGGGVLDRRGVLDPMHGRSRMTIDPRVPTNAGTELVGNPPTRKTLLAPSAKRLGMSMKGELHPTKNLL